MPRLTLLLVSLVSLLVCSSHAASSAGKQPAAYVDLFIATAGDHGQLYPGATRPFGMVKLSPDTYPSGINGSAHSGYNYWDEKILGFSHVRVGGMGCTGEGGNILMMPQIGEPRTKPNEYSTPYVKESERAAPGYYFVRMVNGITVQLTATSHVGFHRYVFPASERAYLLVDLGRGFREIVDAHLEVLGEREIAGRVTARHSCDRKDDYTVYFNAVLSRSFKSFCTWRDQTRRNGRRVLDGKAISVCLDFSFPQGDTLEIKVGVSAISAAQARKDRETELPGWDFEAVRRDAWQEWNRLLSRIEVEGEAEAKRLFYTGVYRSCTMPVNTTSTQGTYRGTDGRVHTAWHHVHYNTYSIWDTFRSKYPLLSLLAPRVLRDIVCSLVDIYREGTHEWPFLTVRREHTASVILDAFRKGITDFDVEAAYEGMKKDAIEQLPARLEELGFVPERPDRTLEYAYHDWCVAKMAELLGKPAEAQRFYRRATFYRNTWDDSLRFPRARAADGGWLPFPDPTVVDEKYVYEGTMWQWRWFVPHDVAGLIRLVGDREAFVSELEYFFEHDLYNHGNQPDLHSAYLFDFAGAPWLTQRYVRQILTEPMRQCYGTHGFFHQPIYDRIYKGAPDGFLLEMDDDCGTMSAWYVLSAMGLYAVCPGEPVYELSSPVFEKVTIHLDEWGKPGGSFVIEAKGASRRNRYIQSAKLNGAPYGRPWIRHEDIVAGGKLEFVLGPEPNKNWGSTPKTAPPSLSRVEMRK